MNTLLTNPAIQSGIIPLVVAFVAAFALKKFGGFWSGLAFAIAYYISVYLAAGFPDLFFQRSRLMWFYSCEQTTRFLPAFLAL